MHYTVTPVSPGIAIGRVKTYQPCNHLKGKQAIPLAKVEDELQRYDIVRARADEELSALSKKIAKSDPDTAKIFNAQRDILNDQVLVQEIRTTIRKDLVSLQKAVQDVYDKYIALLSGSANKLIAQRASDLADVKKSLVKFCGNFKGLDLSNLPAETILVAQELFPSDTASLNFENVVAIVTEEGGVTSHTGIIARSIGIPAVVWGDALKILADEDEVAVDAIAGILVHKPDNGEKKSFFSLRRKWIKEREENARYRKGALLTKDGKRINIGVNIGSASEAELASLDFADGSGLFRTEFLFLGKDSMPNEEEQFQKYRMVLERAKGKPVTLRTLDIGGDKELPYLPLPRENNPFLGVRGIRLCFEHPELFLTQLRAAYRASVFGKLEIMFPMVSSIDDVRRCLDYAKQARNELYRENIEFNSKVPLGIMIEVPSIALMAEEAADLVDFASIGTNDLCQYLTASDRLDARLNTYYQSYHPALFRCIKFVVKAFSSAGKMVGICGELGGEPKAAVLLFGLGINKLSMNADALPSVKRMLSKITLEKSRRIAERILSMQTAEEIMQYLDATLACQLNHTN